MLDFILTGLKWGTAIGAGVLGFYLAPLLAIGFLFFLNIVFEFLTSKGDTNEQGPKKKN